MAKQTQDREDLLRDGTSMPVRARCVVDGIEIFLGFRPGGQLSLYWDQDPVFQFDDQHRLRRVYVDSTRYKASNGRLVALTPTRDSQHPARERLRLIESKLSDDKERQILQLASDRLQQIKAVVDDASRSVTQHAMQCVGAHPVEFCRRVSEWVSHVQEPPKIADSASA